MDMYPQWTLGPGPFAVFLALMCCAGPAAAQTVQTCVGADGHVTLTSAACGAGQRLAASRDAVPEPVPAAAPASAGRRANGGAAPRSVARRGARRAASRSRPAVDRCEAARARRERTLQRVGLQRTFDLLRRLDDEVWAACR